MSTAAVVADPTPAMEVERGPLVNLTGEQRAEYRKTGELPTPKKEEAAPSSEAQKAETATASEAGKTQQETDRKPRQTAEERIAQLEATIEKIRKGSGKETPKAESSPAKTEPAVRTKPTAEDKDKDGKPKYSTYEDFVEDLSDWKTEQRLAAKDREQQQQAQAKEFNSKVEEARSRYENFDEVVSPFATAINTDPKVSPIIRQMFLDSPVTPDLLFTIGGNEAESAKFLRMAKEDPGKAIRYLALTESLITDELESKSKPAEEAPAKPKTQAPKPPSEAGGRAAAPPDALEAAIAGSAGKLTPNIKAEMTRRALAKFKA